MDLEILEGWLPDFARNEFFPGKIQVRNGIIRTITRTGDVQAQVPGNQSGIPVILPGLIDAHVHIESSMVMPSRFAVAAARHGTVATVSDPHEIANVLGLKGVKVMYEDAKRACIKIFLTAPSCVPATAIETSGAMLGAEQLEELFRDREVVALGEMMNFPGVINRMPSVMEKITLAQQYGLPVDGHVPGIVGKELDDYIGAGIQTDHESISYEEAEEKINKGMKVLIREGSAARIFDELWPLIRKYPDRVMLCTDDFHPDDLNEGHINKLIIKGLNKGLNFFDLYRAASLNAIEHYNLPVGSLTVNDPADFIVVNNLLDFNILSTWIRGHPVYGEHAGIQELPVITVCNRFEANPLRANELEVHGPGGRYRVIGVRDEVLVTDPLVRHLYARDGIIQPDIHQDILKIVVVNRYRTAPPSIAWIHGFGLKQGAIASSIAHDSHNLIAVGVDDQSIVLAINDIIKNKGGIAASSGGHTQLLPLPVAGLMSDQGVAETGEKYQELTQRARDQGAGLKAPFMTLSLMALLVIPHLKIGDQGLFDGDQFRFIPLQAD